MSRMSWAVGVSGALFVLGCGGGAQSTEPAPDGTSAGGEVPSTPTADLSWDQMDQQQRAAYMQETVTPAMAALFQEFDGEKFAEFGCPTCHGANMQEVNFKMPNGVAPLDPAKIPAMFESDDAMAKFMTQKVWPKMTELLGQAPYNPETHEGFGCLNCHATAEGAGAAEADGAATEDS